jgi:thiol-disulfide isomerase/thioredoxin
MPTRRTASISLALAWTSGVWAQNNQSPGVSPFPIGQALPNPVRYEFDDGSEIDLAKYRGNPAVVYYGADWCPPCYYARPTAIDMAKKYKQRGVNVLILLSDPEKRRAGNILAAQKGGYLMGMPKRELCKTGDCGYGLKGGPWGAASNRLPSVWVLDKEGVVRAFLSDAQPICDYLESELKKVL